MKWQILNSDTQWKQLLENSKTRTQVIYKHSTRCFTSSLVKGRLEKAQPPLEIDFYFLDLITYRSLSDAIAAEMGVRHESPQVLVIQNGVCIYDESHTAIYMEDIAKHGVRA